MKEKICELCNKSKSQNDFSASRWKLGKPWCIDCKKEYDKNRNKDIVGHLDRKKSICVDCQNPCTTGYQRCQSCATKLCGKNRAQPPKLCEDCGARLAKRKYKKCHSCNMKTRWADKEYYDRVSLSMKDAFDDRWADPSFRQKVVKQLLGSGKSSKLEKRVAKIASNFGFDHFVVVGRYIADLINETRKIIIEVNGDYWHCNPKFWKDDDIHPIKHITAKEMWEKDAKRKAYLEAEGYSVFVIWEDDILHGKNKFIRDFLENIK